MGWCAGSLWADALLEIQRLVNRIPDGEFTEEGGRVLWRVVNYIEGQLGLSDAGYRLSWVKYNAPEILKKGGAFSALAVIEDCSQRLDTCAEILMNKEFELV